MALIRFIKLANNEDSRSSQAKSAKNLSITLDLRRIYYIFSKKEDLAGAFDAHKLIKKLTIRTTKKCFERFDDSFE